MVSRAEGLLTKVGECDDQHSSPAPNSNEDQTTRNRAPDEEKSTTPPVSDEGETRKKRGKNEEKTRKKRGKTEIWSFLARFFLDSCSICAHFLLNLEAVARTPLLDFCSMFCQHLLITERKLPHCLVIFPSTFSCFFVIFCSSFAPQFPVKTRHMVGGLLALHFSDGDWGELLSLCKLCVQKRAHIHWLC